MPTSLCTSLWQIGMMKTVTVHVLDHFETSHQFGAEKHRSI
jgi:hypothetical protein